VACSGSRRVDILVWEPWKVTQLYIHMSYIDEPQVSNS
jgi:hypothetical protein